MTARARRRILSDHPYQPKEILALTRIGDSLPLICQSNQFGFLSFIPGCFCHRPAFFREGAAFAGVHHANLR
jgi:hypothetical protein